MPDPILKIRSAWLSRHTGKGQGITATLTFSNGGKLILGVFRIVLCITGIFLQKVPDVVGREMDRIGDDTLLVGTEIADVFIDAEKILIDGHVTDIVVDVLFVLAGLVLFDLMADEVIDGDMESIGELDENVDGRLDTADFIIGDIVLTDMESLGQLSLGHVVLFA